MSHEMLSHVPEMLPEAVEVGSLLLALAFSKKTRHQILERDGYRSVLSGKTDSLEASHINHDKSNPLYDDPSNGRMLTTAEHFWDHVNRHGTEQLGLSDEANDWAIVMLWKRFWGLDTRNRGGSE